MNPYPDSVYITYSIPLFDHEIEQLYTLYAVMSENDEIMNELSVEKKNWFMSRLSFFRAKYRLSRHSNKKDDKLDSVTSSIKAYKEEDIDY